MGRVQRNNRKTDCEISGSHGESDRQRLVKRLREIIGAKCGTSMVEVLVAFIIVLLMTTMFGGIVTASVRILQQSRTTIERNEAFETKYYQTSERGTDKRVPVCNTFSIAVDTEKTDRRNQAKAATVRVTAGELKKYVHTDAKGNITRYSIDAENVQESTSGEE